MVVIKRASHPHAFHTEREVLRAVRKLIWFRQMVDVIDDQSSLVLEFLDDNLLEVCSQQRLENWEVKKVARTILEVLAMLHENGYVHTG